MSKVYPEYCPECGTALETRITLIFAFSPRSPIPGERFTKTTLVKNAGLFELIEVQHAGRPPGLADDVNPPGFDPETDTLFCPGCNWRSDAHERKRKPDFLDLLAGLDK
jgi:hypothetical protein